MLKMHDFAPSQISGATQTLQAERLNLSTCQNGIRNEDAGTGTGILFEGVNANCREDLCVMACKGLRAAYACDAWLRHLPQGNQNLLGAVLIMKEEPLSGFKTYGIYIFTYNVANPTTSEHDKLATRKVDKKGKGRYGLGQANIQCSICVGS